MVHAKLAAERRPREAVAVYHRRRRWLLVRQVDGVRENHGQLEENLCNTYIILVSFTAMKMTVLAHKLPL